VISRLLKKSLFSLLLITTTTFGIELDFDTEELYILTANKKEIHDSISLFYHKDSIYIPVKLFLNALNIDYTEQNKNYKGWIFNTENTFQLNQSDFFEYEETEYFDVLKFCKENGIKTRNHESDGTLYLTTNKQFFFEIEEYLRNTKIKDKKQQTLPDIKHQYQSYTNPNVSISIESNISEDYKNISGSFITVGDMGYGTINSNINIANNKININHLNYEKITNQNVKGKITTNNTNTTIIGDISAFSLGDISSNSTHQLTSNFRGHGISIRKQNENTTSYFNNEIIDGSYKINQKVELLQNGHVIDETTTNELGYYRFSQTPLFTGQNNYEIKFYGEYGEIHTENITYRITQKLIAKNELNYSAFIINTETNLLGDKLSDNGIIANIEASYGLTNTSTINSGLTILNGNKPYITNSYTKNIQNTTNQIEFITDMNEWGATFKSTGTMFDGNYTFALSKYSDNFSLTNTQQKDVQSFAYNKRINSIPDFISNLSFFIHHKKQQEENRKTNLSKIGVIGRIGQISSKYTFEKNNNLINHNISLNTSLRNVRFRYETKISDKKTSHSLEISKKFFNINTSSKVQYDSITKKQTFNFSARKQFDKFNINAYGLYSDSNYEIGISFSTNLWFNEKPRFSRNSLSQAGSIKANAYIDENYNGMKDKNENGLENITFESNRLWKNIKTNSKGQAILPGVQHLQPTRIKIIEEDIEDFTLSIPKALYVEAHRGGITEVYFPLQRKKSLEIILKNTKGNPIENKRFILTSEKQTIHGYTDEDGYYANETIFPGKFTITLKDNNKLQATFEIKNDKNIEEYYLDNLITINTSKSH